MLTDLLQLSLSPPPPDATCRIHSDTDEDRVIIYQSDPDYKVTTLPLYSLDQQYYKVATLLLYSLEQQHYKVPTLPNFNNAYVTGEVQLNFGILITNISKKYSWYIYMYVKGIDMLTTNSLYFYLNISNPWKCFFWSHGVWDNSATLYRNESLFFSKLRKEVTPNFSANIFKIS